MGAAQNTTDNYMRRALALANRAEGMTAPNPLVGCVIVRDGEIVGEGWHKGPGRDHAEVMSIKDAGPRARGATAYVTLEPCNHTGRTPPCTAAILKAGIADVVYGMADPNPDAAGGAAFLNDHGVTASRDTLMEPACRGANKFWCSRIERGQPYIIGKIAMSLDGRIATKTGDSKWITSAKARTHAHGLRGAVDAILVGADTVIADDPALTARDGEQIKFPLRVVLDSTGRTSPGAAVYDRAGRGAVLITTARTPAKKREQFTAHGVEVLIAETDHQGRPDIDHVIEFLHARGVNGLLVEGGAEIHASFLSAGYYDEVWTYIAPKFIGANGRPAIGDLGLEKLNDAQSAMLATSTQLGPDRLVIAKLSEMSEAF